MPPCAATVCERVGKTFERTATLRPARASCSAARMPEPPAPTITTSNLRRAMLEEVYVMLLDPPEHLHGPAGAAHEVDDHEKLEDEADADGLDVVHQDVAHAHPHVVEQADDGGEREHLHALPGEEAGPLVVADRSPGEEEAREHDDRDDRHQRRRD